MSIDLDQTLKVSSSGREEIIDITAEVSGAVENSGVSAGTCIIFIPHTTAGVTINENADPDVKSDILMGLKKIVPDGLAYDHAEGNSPAHIRSSMMGSSVTILISHGRLKLGVWQGIYFCEFDGPRKRQVYVRVQGE